MGYYGKVAKVFIENGFHGQIYTDDHEPPHVHIHKDGAEVVIALKNRDIIRNRKMKQKDIKIALALVEKHYNAILAKWEEFHG
jgi:hypothetical protein